MSTAVNGTGVEETIEVGPDGVRLKTLAQMRRWAKIALGSGAVRVTADRADAQESEVLLRLQAGLERGYPPSAALEQIHIINGRLCMGGDAMLAMVLRCGRIQVRERFEGEKVPEPGAPAEFWPDDYRAVCTIKRDGQPDEVVGSYSVADAKRAKLWMKTVRGRDGKPRATPWVTNPARMLRYRALGFALRDAAADIVQGLITEEEARDYPAEAAAPFDASKVPLPDDEPPTKPSDRLAARLGQDQAAEAPAPEDLEAQGEAGEEPQAPSPTEEDAPPAEEPPEQKKPTNSRTSGTAKGPPRSVEGMRFELGQMFKALAEHRRCEVQEVYSKAFHALFKSETKMIPLEGITDEKALRRLWNGVSNQCAKDGVKWPHRAKETPA